MPPDILALPLAEGTLFIAPPDRLAAIAGSTQAAAGPYAARLREILARHAEGWRLHRAAVDWGLQSFGRLQRPERNLAEQIARMVESGRLTARFLPLFISDPRGPSETGSLRVYQLDGGPPPAAPPPPQRSASAPPAPQPTIDRSPPPPPQKDFDDEDAQVAVLRAAAKDGTPFCEQCARAALLAAKAAA